MTVDGTDLATFTTEELVAVGFPGVVTEDDPWLSGLGRSDLAAALGAGIRSLVARGLLRLAPTAGQGEAVGALGEIARLCTQADVRVDVAAPRVRHTLHRAEPGVVVHHAAAGGAHRFVLRTEERAAREVVGALGEGGALQLGARHQAGGRVWQATARLAATADGVVLTTRDGTRVVPSADAWTVVAGLLLPPDTR